MIDHAQARTVIPRWLASDGLGRRELLIGLIPEAMVGLPPDLASELARTAPAGEGCNAVAHPLNQSPIPADAKALLAQLAPVVTANPSNTGLNIALLALLAECWPHVGSEERPTLRTRFLNGVLSRAAAVGQPGGTVRESLVTTAELAVWNRYLPTASGSATPAELVRILSATTGQECYRLIANHLMGSVGLPGLAKILATLGLQCAERLHDRDGSAVPMLLGAVAAHRLAGVAADDQMALLLVQLAHQIWWTAQQARLPNRDATGPLVEGLPSPRTARTLGSDLPAWHGRIAPALAVLARRGRADHALACAWLLNRRAVDGRIAPDDVAAIVALVRDGLA